MTRSRQQSRGQLAFDALMDVEADFPVDSVRPTRKSGSTGRRDRRRSSAGAIQLRGRGSSLASPSQEASAGGLEMLHELFGTSLEWAIIDDVFRQCGMSVERATDALLALASQSAPPPGFVAREQGPEGPSAHSCDLWDQLPDELKEEVWVHVTARDAARAARTCREFARRARLRQNLIQNLHLPRDLSAESIVGMVAAHVGARTIRFPPFYVNPQMPDLEALISAVTAGLAQRKSNIALDGVDLHLYNASSPTFPIQDGDVTIICMSLPSLRDFNLKGCSEVTDTLLVMLSKHRPEAPEDFDEDSSPSSAPDRSGLARARHRRSIKLALIHPDGAGNAEDGGDASGDVACDSGGGECEADESHVGPSVSGQLSKRDLTAGLSRLQVEREQPGSAATGLGDWRERRAQAGIRRLVLEGCSNITSTGVQALLRGPASAYSLVALDVSHCTLIGNGALDLNPRGALRVLRANHCRNIQNVILNSGACPNLEELSLASCGQLRRVNISAPRLQSLNVSGSGGLRELVVDCPVLTTLIASQCRKLDDLGPTFVAPQLTTLNMFGCRALRPEGLDEVLSDCPLLRTLNVNGCTNLLHLRLTAQAHLERLDLSGCVNMTLAIIESPLLKDLAAIGCSSLSVLRIDSKVMRQMNLSNCKSLGSINMPGLSHAQEDAYPLPQVRIDVSGCTSLNPYILERIRDYGRAPRDSGSRGRGRG